MNLFQKVGHHERKTSLKVGHIGSETRSLGQMIEKSCVHTRRHSFDPICMKHCQNVCHHEIADKFETGSCWF